tara:strand:- start:261 stop:440 length:180 start_codon:yes stop_codon:yes gene_type:complete
MSSLTDTLIPGVQFPVPMGEKRIFASFDSIFLQSLAFATNEKNNKEKVRAKNFMFVSQS